MTQLVWNAAGQRFFEAGVDHGVLYVDLQGVAWNGLLSVTESPSGGEVSAYYIDGIRYLNRQSLEEFAATIEAYTYPDEFDACIGEVGVAHGLSVTQQPKKSFGLSYRTQIGNDLDGINHGYKLHIVYNAVVTPSDRANKSIGESIEPFNFTWKLSSKPDLKMTGYKPTSHFVIDSRDTPTELMEEISDILYGTSSTSPRLPSVVELMALFVDYEASFFDGGTLTDDFYDLTFDGGHPGDVYTATIDGGSL